MSDKMHQAARMYHNLGYGIIPIRKGGKVPALMAWKEYQTRRPTLEEIDRWWGRDYIGANIALLCGKMHNLTVIDADTPEAQKTIAAHLPSGFVTPEVDTPHGWHLLLQYNESIPNRAGLFPGCDARNDGGYIVAPPSSNGKGIAYKFRAQHNIKNTALQPIPDILLIYIKSLSLYTGRDKERVTIRSHTVTGSNICFTQGGRDETLFHLANSLVKGGMPEEEIEQYLIFIASKCDPPYPAKDVKKKVFSAVSRHQVREKSVAEQVREFFSVTSGNVTVTEIEKFVVWVTSSNKPILMALSRLVKEGLIERIENQKGTYRKVDKDFKVINLNKVSEDEFDVSLPFDLHDHVEILPKDLIVYAGVPNAGKTAIMLDVVRRNMKKHKIWYFSSEMGASNCRKRLQKCEDLTLDAWKFNFIDDFPNYIDVIQPDDINIIDYVEEVSGEAFKIPGILAQIQRKLDKGIAVVALQKNAGVAWAVGGQQTKAKPAVYCTVDPEQSGATMRIVKAKNYRDHNPNGFMLKFNIVGGINLYPDGSFMPEV